MNVIVMMVYVILLISPPEVELLTEDEQLLHSFHCASRVVALLARRKFKTLTFTFTFTPDVDFVIAVTAGGSVKILPAV